MPQPGSLPGLSRRATIIKYNNNGTVKIALDEGGLHQVPQEFIVPIPSNWSGTSGEFAGGFPPSGSSVQVSQSHGGQWLIDSYIPSNNVFINSTLMNDLQSGRYLIQTRGGNKLFLDPVSGIEIGDTNFSFHFDPKKELFSHNYKQKLEFTEAARSVEGVIKRDLNDNSTRHITGTLNSHEYEKSLSIIGLDPKLNTSITTIGNDIRNPAFIECRKLFYEFAHSYDYDSNSNEIAMYSDSEFIPVKLKIDRRENRTENLNLNFNCINHLVECTIGTVVDTFGNILDINRSIIKMDSMKNSDNIVLSFQNNLEKLRNSLAFHFELNCRKNSNPNINSIIDYARNEGNFSLDIDKEGQFKLNIPASSNTGNISFLTRHHNYSTLLAEQDKSISPNTFIRSSDEQEIFAKNFSGKSGISIKGRDVIDYTSSQTIKYGTAFHDITKTCLEFQTSAPYLQAGLKLINFDKNNHLNTDFKPLPQIVSNLITVSGPNANGGGRSGNINTDGHISLNIGANQIDRQSVWLDCAGSFISNIGRDKQGISYAANLDGDCFIQIGGAGIGNSFDSRFADQNDAYRNGTLDIRVLNNGQLTIFRLGPSGIDIISPGNIYLTSQQDMIFRSNGSMKFQAENIVMHAETTKRIVNKFPATSI